LGSVLDHAMSAIGRGRDIGAPHGFGVRSLSRDPLDEVRKTFTVGGKRIPPEIFRDFGDGDFADSGSI
jgi:hypothetical protein